MKMRARESERAERGKNLPTRRTVAFAVEGTTFVPFRRREKDAATLGSVQAGIEHTTVPVDVAAAAVLEIVTAPVTSQAYVVAFVVSKPTPVTVNEPPRRGR